MTEDAELPASQPSEPESDAAPLAWGSADTTTLLDLAAADCAALLDAAASGWTRPVPHCPQWDAAGLVRHMGGIGQWMAALIESGERISRRNLPVAPEDPDQLAPWYRTQLGRALTALGSADPDQPCWTFSSVGDQRAGWWRRRLAVEVAIHRWDAQQAVLAEGDAAAVPPPLADPVAAAGIEEFLMEFLPGLLARDGVYGLSGTLHLHATDGPVEWVVDLDRGGTAVQGHAKADTAVRGSRSDLLLWLTLRAGPDTVEVLGDPTITERWQQLAR